MLVNTGEEKAFSVGVLLYPIMDGAKGTWLTWVSSPLGVLQAACSICSFIGYGSAVALFSGGTVAMQTPIYMKAKQSDTKMKWCCCNETY